MNITVLQYALDFPDDETDMLAGELEAAGVPVVLEPIDVRAGLIDSTLDVVIEVAAVGGTALLGEAMKSLWASTLRAVRTRRERRRTQPRDERPSQRPSDLGSGAVPGRDVSILFRIGPLEIVVPVSALVDPRLSELPSHVAALLDADPGATGVHPWRLEASPPLPDPEIAPPPERGDGNGVPAGDVGKDGSGSA